MSNTKYGAPIELEFDRADIDKGGFHIQAIVAGSKTPINFQLDTGSSGMLLFEEDLEGVDLTQYPSFGPHTMHYYPSLNHHTGIWYFLPVTLNGKNGVSAHSNAMVLVCKRNPANGPAQKDARTVGVGAGTKARFGGPGPVLPIGNGMMGVSAKGENPAFNVLLNVWLPGSSTTVPTPLAPAYVLTQTSVIIGQTHVDDDGYHGTRLSSAPTPALPTQTNQIPVCLPTTPTWAPPQLVGIFTKAVPSAAGLAVTPVTVTLTLEFELDTGINQMLVACDPWSLPPSAVPFPENWNPAQPAELIFADGTDITVQFPAGSQDPALNYTFTVGQTPEPNSQAPHGNTVYMGPAPTGGGNLNRINIGICPLNQNDYIYDSLNGFIGFKPLKPKGKGKGKGK